MTIARGACGGGGGGVCGGTTVSRTQMTGTDPDVPGKIGTKEMVPAGGGTVLEGADVVDEDGVKKFSLGCNLAIRLLRRKGKPSARVEKGIEIV